MDLSGRTQAFVEQRVAALSFLQDVLTENHMLNSEEEALIPPTGLLAWHSGGTAGGFTVNSPEEQFKRMAGLLSNILKADQEIREAFSMDELIEEGGEAFLPHILFNNDILGYFMPLTNEHGGMKVALDTIALCVMAPSIFWAGSASTEVKTAVGVMPPEKLAEFSEDEQRKIIEEFERKYKEGRIEKVDGIWTVSISVYGNVGPMITHSVDNYDIEEGVHYPSTEDLAPPDEPGNWGWTKEWGWYRCDAVETLDKLRGDSSDIIQRVNVFAELIKNGVKDDIDVGMVALWVMMNHGAIDFGTDERNMEEVFIKQNIDGIPLFTSEKRGSIYQVLPNDEFFKTKIKMNPLKDAFKKGRLEKLGTKLEEFDW